MPLLPAVLRDWRDFIFQDMMCGIMDDGAAGERVRACIVMDYQNIHFTARDAFAPWGTPPEDCLIDPLKFAERVISVRDLYLPEAERHRTDVAAVRVFRGAPSNAKQPTLYRVVERQRSEWTRDRRVDVRYRTIKYPLGWPAKPAREKGVDVMVALCFVREVLDREFDLVILASHDTDMEPALDMALSDGVCLAETAGWQGQRVLRTSGLHTRHTALNGAEFVATRDRRNYLPPA